MPTIYDRVQRVTEWDSYEIPFPHKGQNVLLPQNRVPPESAYVLENADIHHLLLRKRWGTKNLGGAITGRIQRYGSFLDQLANSLLWTISTTQIASYLGGAWTTRLSGLTGVATIIPAFTAFQTKGLWTNGVDLPRRWNGITALGDTLTNAPICRALSNLSGRVLAGNVTVGTDRFANRVKWSDFLLENTWTGGSSGEADLIDTDDEIMTFARLRDQVAIMRKRSIWTINAAESPFFYRFERAYEGLGTTAMGSVASIPGGVIFLGPSDLHIFNGADAPPLLPREYSLKRFLEEQTSLDGLKRAVAAVYPSRSQYWLAIPLGGAADNTHVIVVDYENRLLLGRHTFDWSGLGVAEFGEGSEVWNDFDQVWNAYDIPWSLMSSLTQERMLGCRAANSQSLLYDPPLNDVGAGITTTWEPGLTNMASERIRGSDMKMVHRVQVMGELGSGPFTVELGYSHDGATVVYTAPFTIDTTQPDWIFDPSVATEAQWWTVRVKSTGANVALRVASIVLWFSIMSPQPVDLRAWKGGAARG